MFSTFTALFSNLFSGALSIILYILGFYLIISVIVFVHEMGHYLLGKAFGVKAETFSLGFGKELFGFNDRSGTRWKFSLIPAGGYVKFFGDSDEASTPDEKLLKGLVKEEEKAQSLYFKPLYQKALIIIGGPMANLLFAVIILFGFALSFGKTFTEPVITYIEKGGPADIAGLKIGDKILQINHRKVHGFNDIIKEVNLNVAEKILLLRERKAGTLETPNTEIIEVIPKFVITKDMLGNENRTPAIGIASNIITHANLSVPQALYSSLEETKHIMYATLRVLGQIITGKRDTSSLGGPVRIAKYSVQSLDRGLITILWFIAMLSINLGLINLFPIPLLDGGHLVVYIIELLIGESAALKYQTHATKVGFLILIAIFLLATFNDIKSILYK